MTLPSKSPRPFHVLYGGAQRFKAGTFAKMRGMALDFLLRHENAGFLFETDSEVAKPTLARARKKLSQQAIEDFRVDFEDGFGAIDAQTTKQEATRVGAVLAAECSARLVSPWIGLRIPPIDVNDVTLVVLDAFFAAYDSEWPRDHHGRFAVTHPKVTSAQQLRLLAEALTAIESKRGWPAATLAIEAMYEVPTDTSEWNAACDGRLRSIHFGAYDYLSALGVPPEDQCLVHPLATRAQCHLVERFHSTNISISDGATLAMPLGSAREIADAAATQRMQIRNALTLGIQQGWDLHPHQVTVRACVWIEFFLKGEHKNAQRLQAFLQESGRVSRVGSQFDDSASARALVRFFERGHAFGAWSDDDLAALGFDATVRASDLWKRLLA